MNSRLSEKLGIGVVYVALFSKTIEHFIQSHQAAKSSLSSSFSRHSLLLLAFLERYQFRLLVSITLLALSVGWYIRRFGKKKWLGYIISFIGFLPILPIMVAGSIVSWLGKQYWKSGKVRASKASTAKEPTNIIDDWEHSFKGLES